MSEQRGGALEVFRMPNGDVRLDFRAKRDHHWEIVASLHVAAGDWVALIAQAAGRCDSEGVLEAGDYHLGKMAED